MDLGSLHRLANMIRLLSTTRLNRCRGPHLGFRRLLSTIKTKK